MGIDGDTSCSFIEASLASLGMAILLSYRVFAIFAHSHARSLPAPDAFPRALLVPPTSSGLLFLLLLWSSTMILFLPPNATSRSLPHAPDRLGQHWASRDRHQRDEQPPSNLPARHLFGCAPDRLGQQRADRDLLDLRGVLRHLSPSVSPSKLRKIRHGFWGESLGRLQQNGQETRGAQVPRHTTSRSGTVLATTTSSSSDSSIRETAGSLKSPEVIRAT